jgi:hypothetical protein
VANSSGLRPNRALLFFTIQAGLQIWMWFGDDFYISSSYRDEINRAAFHLGVTGAFFRCLTDTFLFITFVELANGFMLCVQGPGEPSKMRKFSRIAAFVWGFVLVAIALGLFGAGNAFYARLYGERNDSSSELELVRDGERITQLEGALAILFWLTSIPAIILASFAQHKARRNGTLSSVRLFSFSPKPTPP